MFAEAEVKPTEDKDKVSRAITNLFTGLLVERSEGNRVYLALKADGVNALERFRMVIQRDRIRAAARAVLRKASGADGIQVYLNKQVAFVSHVSFCEPEGESPLGPIRLVIQTSDPSKVVSWVTGGESQRFRQPSAVRSKTSPEFDSEAP